MYSYPENLTDIAVVVSLSEAADLYQFASSMSEDSGAGRDLADELALYVFTDFSQKSPEKFRAEVGASCV